MGKYGRWVIVASALVLQLCLGAIYAWSVFVKPLKDAFAYTTTQTQIIFSVALASFALVMIFAGLWQDKKGPRLVATIGGALFGLGFILASYSGGNFLLITLAIGLVGGAGLGFAYVCPIAACMKWFPDKRGLITGLAVAGFGAGAWVFSQIATTFIDSYGLLSAFQYLGIIFFVAIVFSAQFLKNPPECWIPEGWTPPTPDYGKKCLAENVGWRQMVKTRQFWMLWVMYMFTASAGLMVIGNLKPFGVYSGLSAVAAGAAVGILALFNGAGRIVWGTVSDRFGRNNAMAVMFILQGMMMLALTRMGSSELALAVAAAWIGFNYGGDFSLFPSATADYFGTKNLGVNYGLVFTSYGIAGIVGPVLAGMVFDSTGNYLWAFIPSGLMCIAAAVMAYTLKNPREKRG